MFVRKKTTGVYLYHRKSKTGSKQTYWRISKIESGSRIANARIQIKVKNTNKVTSQVSQCHKMINFKMLQILIQCTNSEKNRVLQWIWIQGNSLCIGPKKKYLYLRNDVKLWQSNSSLQWILACHPLQRSVVVIITHPFKAFICVNIKHSYKI